MKTLGIFCAFLMISSAASWPRRNCSRRIRSKRLDSGRSRNDWNENNFTFLQACGTSLSELLSQACNGSGYNTYHGRGSVIMSSNGTFSTSNIVTECCRHSCTWEDLKSYCLPTTISQINDTSVFTVPTVITKTRPELNVVHVEPFIATEEVKGYNTTSNTVKKFHISSSSKARNFLYEVADDAPVEKETSLRAQNQEPVLSTTEHKYGGVIFETIDPLDVGDLVILGYN